MAAWSLSLLGRVIPWSLIVLRVLLCPLIVVGAQSGWRGMWLALIVVVALVSDIYDGVLARRWDKETPALRVSDSLADTIFYLGVAAALWLKTPDAIRNNKYGFASLFGLEGFRYIFDFIKYRKTASYHSYLAKFWGIVLAFATVGVFAFAGGVFMVRVALVVGVVVNLEGLTMSLMLPRWKNDVATLGVAWRLRKTMLENTR